MADYWEVPGFEHVYLEDSWVLSVELNEQTLEVMADVVLLESHPQYKAPRLGEMYCYGRSMISFEHVMSYKWSDRHSYPPARDKNDELDYGSFDTFRVIDGVTTLVGGFGRIEIVSDRPKLRRHRE